MQVLDTANAGEILHGMKRFKRKKDEKIDDDIDNENDVAAHDHSFLFLPIEK